MMAQAGRRACASRRCTEYKNPLCNCSLPVLPLLSQLPVSGRSVRLRRVGMLGWARWVAKAKFEVGPAPACGGSDWKWASWRHPSKASK